MLFEFNLYSSILLIFFVHAIVYAVLLLVKSYKKDAIADRFLALFLLLCALYICPWMLGFANWYNTNNPIYRNIIFYIPFQQMLFMGPCIYFYVQSLLNPNFRLLKNQWIHFLPGILYFVWSIIMFVCDEFILSTVYFYADGSDRDMDLWHQLLGIISGIYYLLLSMQYYRVYHKFIYQVSSTAFTIQFKWVRNFLIAFGVYLFLFIIIIIIQNLIIGLSYAQAWYYYLFFAIIMYYIAINGYSNAIVTKLPQQLFRKNNEPLKIGYNTKEHFEYIEDAEVEIITESKKEEDIQNWKSKILQLVYEQEMYKNTELTLPDLAKKLQTNATVLSKAINKGFAMNFNDFVNYYRVQAVLNLLKKGEQEKQTLLGIAFESGFNSKATFNRAFKKVMLVTPKEWLEQNRST
jgi:AraC-like DNA-binding protein